MKDRATLNITGHRESLHKGVSLCPCVCFCFLRSPLQGTCNEDEHKETEDGVKFGEHGEHHGRTEGVVTAADGRDAVGTYFCLADGREQGYCAEGESCAEDG